MDSVEELSETLKALSDPTRLRLIRLLKRPKEYLANDDCCKGRGFYCVNALAQLLGVSQSAVSQHLRILRQVHLVRGIRHGKFMHYVVDEEGLVKFNEVFTEVIENDSAT